MQHFRKFYPNAHITLCVKKYAVNLMEHCPHIDEIVVWEEIQDTFLDRLSEFKGRWRLTNMIKRFRISKLTFLKPVYDLFLLPIRSPVLEMHQFAKFIRAKKKICIIDNARREILSRKELQHIYTEFFEVSDNREFDHELNIHQDFLQFLGMSVTRDDLHPEIFTTEQDRVWARNHIQTNDKSVLLAICPGVTSRPEKFYAAANYQMALSGFENHTFSVVILGSKGEMDQCSRVEKALNDCRQVESIQNLAGKTTIRQLAECLRMSEITISNETGALHLATALKKPTIGIMGGGHFGRFYPWGDPAINLTAHHPMDCYFCNWICKYPTMKCIHDMKPEVITNKLSQLLENH